MILQGKGSADEVSDAGKPSEGPSQETAIVEKPLDATVIVKAPPRTNSYRRQRRRAGDCCGGDSAIFIRLAPVGLRQWVES